MKDIWIKKWVYGSSEANDQRTELLLGNGSASGLLTSDQILLLRNLQGTEEKAYSDNFYRFQYLDKLLLDYNIYQCDVATCEKIFVDVAQLRKHVMEKHADEGLRKIASSGSGSTITPATTPAFSPAAPT